MVRLVSPTHCSNEHMDVCGYVFVELTEELLNKMVKRAALFDATKAQDSSLSTMAFYDCETEFFDVDGTTELGERIDETAWTAAPAPGVPSDWQVIHEAIPEEWKQRTECDRFVVSVYGDCWFEAIPKHGDYTVESRPFQVRELRELFERTDEPSACPIRSVT